MKFFFSLLTGFFLCVSSFGQSADTYSIYPNQIKRFLKPAKILNKSIDLHGNGSIEFANAKNQILRFRLRNNKLQQGSCSIAFEIYYYKNNYLKRIESLDRNGNLIECNLKLNNEAAIEYTIEKPESYLKKRS